MPTLERRPSRFGGEEKKKKKKKIKKQNKTKPHLPAPNKIRLKEDGFSMANKKNKQVLEMDKVFLLNLFLQRVFSSPKNKILK